MREGKAESVRNAARFGDLCSDLGKMLDFVSEGHIFEQEFEAVK